MTVKELKETIKDLPDSYHVMIEYKDYSKGRLPCEKALFSEYVQKDCYAQVYTGNTLMIIEKEYK